MVDTAERNRKLIADLAAKGARLGNANMVRIARCTAADDTGLAATNVRCSLSRNRMPFWTTGLMERVRPNGSPSHHQ